MPRLDDEISRTVFYLFRRNPKTGAIDGSPCGSGCFVLRRSVGTPGLDHVYAVSNWHVTQDAGASIIRVNTAPGKSRMIEFDPSEWTFSPRADDLSAIDVTDDLSISTDQFACIAEASFIGLDEYDRYKIDIGEDTVMLGVFSAHHGGDRNIPVARFGNIGMVPRLNSPVLQPNGNLRQSYLVDTRSRGGFSGSPVFVYRTSAGDIRQNRRMLSLLQDNHIFGLLGVHCGQYWEPVEVRKRLAAEATGDPILEGDELGIEGGMTIVVPAWEISFLLDHEDFEMKRRDRDQKRRQAWENLPVPEASESDGLPASDENSTN